MVAERQYLILFTLKCIAEPSAIYHQPPRDGDAFGLVSNQSNVHNFTLFSYVRSAQVMLLREVVRLWRIVSASPRLPLRSSHHLPTGTLPTLCVLYFADGDITRDSGSGSLSLSDSR